MHRYEDLTAEAAALRERERKQAKERLAARRAELAQLKKDGKRDADLELLLGEAADAYDRGAYWTAVNLLSDETLAHQRGLS